MAKHRHHHHRRRRNPFGISKGVIVDAGYNAAGALGSLWLTNLLPSFASGWTGVAATAGAAIVASYAGKMVGGARASDELLKGGLTATIIKALHQLGVAQSLGLGLYSPSQFYVPTSSNAYMRTYGTGNSNRPIALPAPAAGVHGMGFHRFRSRYAGNY
jgi:hypothetical protein